MIVSTDDQYTLVRIAAHSTTSMLTFAIGRMLVTSNTLPLMVIKADFLRLELEEVVWAALISVQQIQISNTKYFIQVKLRAIFSDLKTAACPL